MKSDIEIAQEVTLKPISEIASMLDLSEDELMFYGSYKAKVPVRMLEEFKSKKDGKLVLVTSMTPTRAGEGKTTTTVGLTQGLRKKGMNAVLCIREPSLGPVMGIKGGAAGGGYSQVLPMEDINLFFTGDIPAVTAANNLLSAVIDNHIFQGNKMNINPNAVVWKRVTDMNDRSLRRIFIGLGDSTGIAREDGYNITAASEVMAVLCLAESYKDLKQRLGRIVAAITFFGEPVTVKELGVEGAMAALLRDAFNPNLVQTIEGGPAFIHGGPFANIAHGCNSVVATKMALKLADIVVTEAGFGADLGAEKFFDIKCRQSGLKPDAVVLVATIRALKHHGGVTDYDTPNPKAVEIGLVNLEKQIENVKLYGLPMVVAINKFSTDSKEEIELVRKECEKMKVPVAISDVHANGGKGGVELATALLDIIDDPKDFKFNYELDIPIKEKIGLICSKVYGASGVDYTKSAENDIRLLEEQGFGNLPICMSKTEKSLSDDTSLLGRPSGFNITMRKVRVSAGAGFLVAMVGKLIAMPGLPRKPAAEEISITDEGRITGLF